MSARSYDDPPVTEETAERIYRILIEHAGASDDDYDVLSFKLKQAREHHVEWRFMGSLGFGGKFWRNDGRWEVDCYPESRTPERDATIERTNAALAKLFAEVNGRAMGT